MDGWNDKWMDGRMNEWMSERMNRRPGNGLIIR